LTVGALVAAASTGHVLYPAYLALASRRRRAASRSDPEKWPAVTVLVAAYGEAECIGAKVRDVLANGYPGPLDVMVVADADIETAVRAEQAGATVVTADERLGKAQALNLGFSKVTAPVVVVSDANNVIAPGAIAALVRHLGDPRVGAVAGEKLEADGAGEDLYWRFESWLKQREWRLGTTIGLVGELAAIRTEAWQPVPLDIATDDLWTALDLSARGYVIAYEPGARAFDPPVPTLGHQWERRTRSVSGAMHVFMRRRRQLGPAGGVVAVQIWGHRLARYTIAPLAHLFLFLMAVRRVRTSKLAGWFLAGHLVALWGLARKATTPSKPSGPLHSTEPEPKPGDRGGPASRAQAAGTEVAKRVADASGQAVFLNAVAIGGLLRYLRGDRLTKWPVLRRPKSM
jgi:cellulose synthase/poly-beta-1,6-N-acetylglucosamine synthase-like glycosyltransferase